MPHFGATNKRIVQQRVMVDIFVVHDQIEQIETMTFMTNIEPYEDLALCVR